MSRRGWVVVGALAICLAAGAYAMRGHWLSPRASAQAPAAAPQQRQVPVEAAKAVRKPVPVRIEALGTVTPMASVAIKSRLETEITGVHFADGAAVKAGDLLFTLDSRALEAQIAQAEGVLTRDKAQLEGSERDVKRFTELLARNAGTQVSVDNAKTQADMLRGTVKADEALLRNLRVQASYNKIQAPISGRISAASVKLGNFVRPADTVALATIIQTKPVYVTFAVPQRILAEVRQAQAKGGGSVEATAPGQAEPSVGKVSMIENTVDVTSGMVPVRAIMDNEDEALWPGTLVNVSFTLRTEDAVVVPSQAVQVGQSGPYVFVVKDGVAAVTPVSVERTVFGETVLSKGIEGGETVVTDGQLLLTNGTRVAPRPRRGQAGS